MANYYGSARSNYFKVKDEDAFKAALSEIPDIEVHGSDKGFCVLVGSSSDSGAWPCWGWDEDGEEYEIDIPEIVSEHLQDNEVAIFEEVGAEKLRYLIGYAEAINNKGERRSISLNNILELAEELTDKPENITSAEY